MQAMVTSYRASQISFIYSLAHAKKKIVKLGYSYLPHARMREISEVEPIDAARSLVVPVLRHGVGVIERAIHAVAKPSYVWIGWEAYRKGATSEWFRASVMPEILAFIEEHPARFPFGGFRPMDDVSPIYFSDRAD